MAGKSKIEWTEMTWNPVTGCTKLSPGCKFCYAETMSHRLKAMGAAGYGNGFDISLMRNRLDHPIKRKKPTIWFVNSMSDLFHEKVPFSFIEEVMRTIAVTPQHIYQILTKRPQRMERFFRKRAVPNNAWLGVTVEDKRYGVPRIDELRNISSTVRFLSIEPLLEDIGKINLLDIHWVIVGGETGAKSRPMAIEWARSIKRQCDVAGVPFFFKQWGSHGADGLRRNKSANGRELDGQTYNAMPQQVL